jgi:putative hydrolase of the HAD superfamily
MIAIFDFFGVVIDWGSEYVLPQWAKYTGVSEADFKKSWNDELAHCETGEISEEELFKRLGKKFNVDPSGLENILKTTFETRAKLNEDVVKIVGSLPDVVLLSNQLPLHAEVARKKGWFSYFKKVFLSYELGYRKPDAKAYLAVLKTLGIKPEDIVFVDDKEENVKAAAALGIKVILYKGAARLKAELDKIYKPSMSK